MYKCEICEEICDDLIDTEGLPNGGVGFVCEQCFEDIQS